MKPESTRFGLVVELMRREPAASNLLKTKTDSKKVLKSKCTPYFLEFEDE